MRKDRPLIRKVEKQVAEESFKIEELMIETLAFTGWF